MICKNCGTYTEDRFEICKNCGALLTNDAAAYSPDVDYQNMYYQQRVQRNDEIKNGFNSAVNSFNSGINAAAESVNKGFNNVSNSINSAVQSGADYLNNKSDIEKRGDTAFILGIIGLVLSVLGFNVISLGLGIAAIVLGKKAFEQTKLQKHNTAKILGIIATAVSSVTIVAGIAFLIVSIVLSYKTKRFDYYDYLYDFF